MRTFPPVNLLVRALRTVRGADPRGLALVLALQLAAAVAGLGLVLAGKFLIDAIASGEDQGLLVWAALLLAVSSAVSGSVAVVYGQRLRVTGERVAQEIWRRLLEQTTRTDLITFERIGYVDRLARIQSDAANRPFDVATALLGIVGALMGILTMASVLVGIEPLLLPLLLCAGVPTVLISRRASQSEFDYSTRVTPVMRHRAYLRLLMTFRPFAAELRSMESAPRLRRLHDEDDSRSLALLRSQVKHRQRYALFTTLVNAATLGATLLTIVALLQNGALGLGDAGAAAIATRVLAGQLGSAFGSAGTLVESLPFLRDLEDFVAPTAPATPPTDPIPLRMGVSLEQVVFTYPGRTEPALRSVDIDVPAGTVVALVGENGSGKTTAAKILAGLYKPESGQLLWDGVPVADGSIIRASVSALFQDFVRYQFSVRENISIGARSNVRPADTERMAAELAGIASAIDQLPEGYDTMLGKEVSEGVDLSGGQWQRLALARALHRDAPLLLMDEPTAALDARAEYELFGTVEGVLRGRTAVIISHRFASVRWADRIYVLDRGQVTESGTHDELIAAGGAYARMFAMQSAAYIEPLTTRASTSLSEAPTFDDA